MKTQIVTSDIFDSHNDNNHPENSKRTDVMKEALKRAPFFEDLELVPPKEMPEEILYEVHSNRMIENIKDMSNYSQSWLDPDTYVSFSDYNTASLAAGSVLHLSENVILKNARNGFAIVRPPGHHATRDRSMGFCLFNNIALAAHNLTKMGKKVLIFDHDVHHGNGTQDIFYNRNDVMYQSFHLSPHYPGTGSIYEIGENSGEGYTINAPLGYGNGNISVDYLLDEIFLPIAKQFRPDIVLVSAGFDSHHSDPLGGLRLTADYFGEIIKKLQSVQEKIVITLEGGYNLLWLDKCFISEIEQLTSNEISFKESVDDSTKIKFVLKELYDEMVKYWRI